MPQIEKDALFVIDGSYLLYRSYYAIKQLQTSTGIPTQAVYGFCRAIKKIIDTFAPKHLVVAWDSKGKTFRHDQHPSYKATRQKPPSDLFVQKEYIIQFLSAVKIAQINIDGYEGDDVIASLTTHFNKHQAVLVCPDKDMYQLLSDHVLIFDPFKERLVDAALFEQENGFSPSKVPFYYALLGDASDNIPGVSGIGKKGAQELVVEFNSLEDLYKHIDRVPKERTRSLLNEQKELALLSYKLFLLQPPPLPHKLSDFAFNPVNWAAALDLFTQLEFSSLVKDINKRFSEAITQKGPSNSDHNLSLFTFNEEEPLSAEEKKQAWKLGLVQDEEALKNMIAVLKEADYIALDTETTGSIPMHDELVGISFSINAHEAFYLPIGHHEGKQIDRATVIAAIKPMLENKTIRLVMHNAKFDQLVLACAGITTPPVVFDTIIAAGLLRQGDKDRINLKALSMSYLHEPMLKFKDVLGKQRTTFAEVPVEEGALYGAHDALQTYKLKAILEKNLNQHPTLLKLFHEIEMPFYQVLWRMEEYGILLDATKIRSTMTAVEDEISKIEAKILAAIPHHHGGGAINLNSPKQVEQLLFDQLGLPSGKKSAKGNRSTDQEVLQSLAEKHPIPGLILSYRELTKLKTTYLEPLPGYVNKKTGRIHTSYSQTQVATGRLSSTDPNLQNIPVSAGFGMQIRDSFYAPEGKVLLSADYSQVELRILAHLSQDKALINIFLHGHDIHTETSAQLFDIPASQVTHDQRQLGKRINFSIMYGVTPYGLAKDLGIKASEAKTYIEKYFERFPGVAAWIERTTDQAIQNGYVETWYGRRRYIPELAERNKMLFEAGKRMAINTPVQGTQAEIMKLAMINIDNTFITQKLEARLILQIHDEIIVEVPNTELATVTSIIQELMTQVVSWEVPLNVTIRTGKTWGEITK